MRLDAQLADERRCTVFGVKGTSALAGLEYFDMVWGLSVDYMHNVWIQITENKILRMYSDLMEKTDNIQAKSRLVPISDRLQTRHSNFVKNVLFKKKTGS